VTNVTDRTSNAGGATGDDTPDFDREYRRTVTYSDAGVSIHAGERAVELLKSKVHRTSRPEVVGDIGGFAGLFRLDVQKYKQPLLASSTDGVGTKLVIAQQMDVHDTVGVDLVAMVVDDLVACGAEPLFLLDYVAANRIVLEQVAELVEGAAEVCRAAGCALIGGETAELPGVYREGELDFAGTMVGLVRRVELIDGSRCEPGDAVLGLPSSGLHANGFTLVRELLGDEPFDADLLLAPTRLYLEDMRRLRSRCDVRALAHVTGGGIPGNLPRALPAGLGARIDPESWERPRAFAWLDERGVSEEEQRRVFNLGIGYCAVVPAVEAVAAGFPVIGRLEEGIEGVAWTDAR